MTPADFFNNIAAPNVAALGSDVGDIRLAVNAILSLDALMGVIHADRHRRGLETPDDSAFRNKLAAQIEANNAQDARLADVVTRDVLSVLQGMI